MEKSTMENLGRLSVPDFKSREKYPLTLVLDEVRSGLNVGSIFRTADAFALEQVILCGITAQPPHREILKTALGSTESVTWRYFEETVQAVQWLKQEGYLVLAVEQTTQKLWLQEFQPLPDQRYAFIMGNEVEGVSETVLPLCDGALEIPQFGTKHSLNVAVAAGIVAWEFVRKSSITQP
ncbi:MAG: RNA methyltransferase [Saprospiraceae bacterium]|nr:RNA methyltransferase [Saprospiraceae bacterium]